MTFPVLSANNPASAPYTIARSVRLRSSATAYLNRTNSSSPTNAIKWTWSGWVKRGSLGAQQNLVGATNSGSDDTYFQFNSSDQIVLGSYTGAGTDYGIRTSAVFRDPSAWYHIVAVLDTANATSADRAIIYVNGVRQAVTNAASGMWPQNATNNKINTASQVVNIGRRSLGDSYLDGYLTEINFVDGQALTPTSFGKYNSYGVWSPIRYTGTYGTNGFYLNFSDNSAATAAALGKDYSGNGNNWTPNNISLTAGANYDSMTDVPTLTSATAANYAVMNPLFSSPAGVFTLSNGNLAFSGTSGATASYFCRSTFGVSSGKWYWEVTPTAVGGGPNIYIGIQDATYSLNSGSFNQAQSAYVYVFDGTKLSGSTSAAYGASYTNNDVIGVALDMGAGTLTFYKNNVSQGTAYTGLTGSFSPVVILNVGGAVRTITGTFNFGQRPFTYTPPSGFVALNAFNIATPSIENGATVMAATLYTGTGASNTISNGNNNTIGTTFQPDLVWIKSRSGATNNKLVDAVRGATLALVSNASTAQTTDANGLTAFGSTGFTVGTDTIYNNNTATYVGWQWQAGAGSTSSNTNGSITTTVSVNASAGFSVLTYTGNGTNGATIGHGLGVAPSMVIIKRRNTSGSWFVYHTSLGATGAVFLESTASTSTSATYWNNTAPTSNVITLGTTAGLNANTSTFVGYCWAAVAGYSAFGSYSGNGIADGPFVYTGFRPRFILLKDTTSGSANWILQDTSRFTYNVATGGLSPNVSDAEASTGYDIDILSNGFKIRTSATIVNGGTYIYAAFAENPFKLALAR